MHRHHPGQSSQAASASFLPATSLPRSRHSLLPSLDLQPPLQLAHLLISPALWATPLPGRNQPWATQPPAFSAPAHRLAGATRGLGTAAGLEKSKSQPQPGSCFPCGKSSRVGLAIPLPSHGRCFSLSLQTPNKIQSLPHKR